MPIFEVVVRHEHHFPQAPGSESILGAINSMKEQIMTTQTETKAILEEISANLTEAGTELGAKIDELQTALANAGHNTAEVDALLEGIRTKAKGLADVVPNPAP